MPIYSYKCVVCDSDFEALQAMGDLPRYHCGEPAQKIPCFPAMVKIKGEGGYPSRRKYFKGSAPYSGHAREWNKYENNAFEGGEERHHGAMVS